MKHLALVFYLIGTLGAMAQPEQPVPDPVARWQANPVEPIPAAEISLEAFRWRARPLVVFADSPFDPKFKQQMKLLAERPEALIERDVVIITDADPAARSPVRERLRPHGFGIVLLSKEGEVALRKPFPWGARELTAAIDKMPLRQQEIEGG